MKGKVIDSICLVGILAEMCGSGRETLWWCAVKPAMI
jgi:hypothetical protein